MVGPVRVDIDPRRFDEGLSERDQMLWARFFARQGLRLEDVASFVVDDERRHVEIDVMLLRDESSGIMYVERVVPVSWFSIPLMNRTIRRFTLS